MTTTTGLSVDQIQAALDATAANRNGLPYLDYRVVFDPDEGRPEYAVHADLRDYRKAEATVGHDMQGPDQMGFTMALAWAYLTRKGEISDTWAAFQDICAFVLPLEDEPTSADPTGTATAG